MTCRVLPPALWHRLPAETEIPWDRLDPARNQVLVTEHDGAITGCVVLMQVAHAEFLWIAPGYRGRVSVGRRLLERVQREARRLSAPTLVMAALSKTMNGILCGLGAERLPGDHYVLPLQEPRSCHQ